MKTYKTAIVGCGSIHNVHAAALANNPKTELIAVADIDPDKALKTSKTYGCKYFKDLSELLDIKELDAIHILTPHYLHTPMAIEALKAGKHVLVEKPMAVSVTEGEELVRVSEKAGKKLGICFQNRYNSTTLKMKEILQSGKAGSILGGKAIVTWNRGHSYYKDSEWKGTWAKEGGGVLINQAIHSLDLLLYFMGEIDCIKGNIDTRLLYDLIEVEDNAEATIRFKSGANAIFFATNCYAADSPVEIELICEKAQIKLSEDLIVKYADGRFEKFSETEKATGEKAYWGLSHKELINDFYNSLESPGKFWLNGAEGIKSIKAIEAIYKSSKERRYFKL